MKNIFNLLIDIVIIAGVTFYSLLILPYLLYHGIRGIMTFNKEAKGLDLALRGSE